MSLFLLENVGSGLNIREEGVKDWKAEKWYVVYTRMNSVYIVVSSITPGEKRQSL